MTSGWARVPSIQPDKDCSDWGCAGCNKCVDVLDEADGEGRFPERGDAIKRREVVLGTLALASQQEHVRCTFNTYSLGLSMGNCTHSARMSSIRKSCGTLPCRLFIHHDPSKVETVRFKLLLFTDLKPTLG